MSYIKRRTLDKHAYINLWLSNIPPSPLNSLELHKDTPKVKNLTASELAELRRKYEPLHRIWLAWIGNHRIYSVETLHMFLYRLKRIKTPLYQWSRYHSLAKLLTGGEVMEVLHRYGVVVSKELIHPIPPVDQLDIDGKLVDGLKALGLELEQDTDTNRNFEATKKNTDPLAAEYLAEGYGESSIQGLRLPLHMKFADLTNTPVAETAVELNLRKPKSRVGKTYSRRWVNRGDLPNASKWKFNGECLTCGHMQMIDYRNTSTPCIACEKAAHLEANPDTKGEANKYQVLRQAVVIYLTTDGLVVTQHSQAVPPKAWGKAVVTRTDKGTVFRALDGEPFKTNSAFYAFRSAHDKALAARAKGYELSAKERAMEAELTDLDGSVLANYTDNLSPNLLADLPDAFADCSNSASSADEQREHDEAQAHREEQAIRSSPLTNFDLPDF